MTHEHCSMCFKRLCTDDFANVCCMTSCDNHCGAIFHACKKQDHEYLCPKAISQCVNMRYGCPIQLQKGDMKNHLSCCPASTIVCTMEWSRMCVEKDKSLNTNFFDPSACTTVQLDIALALHDQCLALHSLKQKMQENDVKTEANGEMTSNSVIQTYLKKQLELKHGENVSHLCVEDFSNFPYPISNLPIANNLATHGAPSDCDSDASLAAGCSSKTQSNVPDVNNGIELLWNKAVDTHSRTVGRAIAEDFLQKEGNLFLTNAFEDGCYSLLGLNTVIECLPRYDTKQRNMFTFMCNNLLRRDEFCSHYQNFHCDLHGCMNGWLEERCPYYLHGCNYTRFRLIPDKPGAYLGFDNTRSCLCVQYFQQSQHLPGMPHPHLLSLPWELLREIISFLDSHSIGQLSATCIYLKNICSSFLVERGIVELEWKNCGVGKGFRWKESGYRWFFSNKSSSIKKWVLNKQPLMASHVAQCPYAKPYKSRYAECSQYKLEYLGVVGNHHKKTSK